MGRDERGNREQRLMVLDSIRGHDSTVAHTFNHTQGRCPKCNCDQQLMAFCLPGSELPRVRGCELEGEHLHRVCAACKYPWIERPLDQAMLAEQAGEIPAESQLAAAFALVIERAGGIRLDMALIGTYRGRVIRFERDPEQGSVTMSVLEPVVQRGVAVHPDPDDLAPPGA